MDLQELMNKPLEITFENEPNWRRLERDIRNAAPSCSVLVDHIGLPDPDDVVVHGERFEMN